MDTRPTIALTVGDPAGIGPEVVRATIADPDVVRDARLVVLGPACERPDGVVLAERDGLRAGPDVVWHVPEDLRALGDEPARTPPWTPAWTPPWTMGRAQASAGRVALSALRLGAELAHAGAVDALVTAPVSKEALHLAGERCEGQTELLGRWAGAEVEMLAIAGAMRVLLLTRHMPLARAIASITTAGVERHLALLDAGLRELGFDAPRLALAGLNPHAGEAGILGDEEGRLLEPAVRNARARGLDVTGPEPPDTVFLRAFEGAFDAVLALYHDQAFIPVKLAAPRTGLTVLLGLPYLRVSPAHGTAFDIAGRGVADATNLKLAVRRAAEWARARQSSERGSSSSETESARSRSRA